MTPIIYVILNKDLNMSPGKSAAQAVHAAFMLNNKSKKDFVLEYRRTVIVLEGTTEQIRNLWEYLDGADIDSDYYIDEGVNEVDAFSITALAAFVTDNEERDLQQDREIFAGFNLYGWPQKKKWYQR